MTNQPQYIPSSATPPGVPAPTGDPRTQTIGLVALILGILESIYATYQLAGSLLSKYIVQWEKAFLGGMPGSKAAMPPPMFDAMDAMLKKIALGQSLRMVAFLAVTAWLIVIAVQLRRGSIEALESAKSWLWLALGAIGLSILIQAFVTAPAQIEYQNAVFASMPSPGSAPPPGFMQGMSLMTNVMIVVTIAVGALLMAIWPIALRIWADKIQKQVGAGAPGGNRGQGA